MLQHALPAGLEETSGLRRAHRLTASSRHHTGVGTVDVLLGVPEPMLELLGVMPRLGPSAHNLKVLIMNSFTASTSGFDPHWNGYSSWVTRTIAPDSA